MLIDCDRCSARAVRCDSCVVGLMLGPPAVRPADVRPTAVRPADVRPADVRPADVRPADVRRPAVRPADVGVPTDTPTVTVTVDLYTAHAAQFNTAEQRALAALAGAGLVPPLRRSGPEQADTNCGYVLTERESLAG